MGSLKSDVYDASISIVFAAKDTSLKLQSTFAWAISLVSPWLMPKNEDTMFYILS